MEEWGNSLFQIAATIGYARKYSVNYVFPKYKDQNSINISQDKFITLPDVNTRYDESEFKHTEIPFQENSELHNLHGYFQSWKYFDHCKEEIKQAFTPKPINNPELFRGVCSIHVRRGDYLKYPGHHPTQGLEYYKRAMKLIPCDKFLVISDDPEYCKRIFKGDQFIVSESAPQDVDFKTMISCSHHIIANSSFSWWAAYLGDSSEKVIVAPKNWFGPKLSSTHKIDDLIPSHWKLV